MESSQVDVTHMVLAIPMMLAYIRNVIEIRIKYGLSCDVYNAALELLNTAFERVQYCDYQNAYEIGQQVVGMLKDYESTTTQ